MIVLFARRIDWSVTWAAIRTANVGILLIATAINLGSAATKAVRWWIFLRAAGARSFGLALRATLAGLGLNNVLVANGGEAARVIFVARAAHLPSATVLATVALERLFELVGYVVLLSLSAILLDLPATLARTRPFALVALVAIGVLLAYLVRRPAVTAELAAELAAPPPTGFLRRARSYGSRFLATLGGVSTGPRFAAALALSVAGWVLQVATYQLTARAAHFPIPLVATISAILAVNIGFALRATPGNVGLFQFMYAATATAFGLDKERAVAVALLIQTQQILPITALGVSLAPRFVFTRRRGQRASDPVDDVPFESRDET
ncbi:MAG: flippase-like domain-containing protein, partial [Gemmatimonadota bacterium]|nr:flippase-like domain-containing protein [Gemmatimonadota bacterium]